MYKLNYNAQVNPNSGLLQVSEDAYHTLYEEASKHPLSLFKFNTHTSISEGMWALCVDQEGIDLSQNNDSHNEQFLAMVANDSVFIPPMVAGTLVMMRTNGNQRPYLCRESFIEYVSKTLPEDEIEIVKSIFEEDLM